MNSRGMSGGNFINRTMSFTGLTPGMQWSDRTAQSLGQEQTRGSLGGRFSGPLRMNTAYYNVSYQLDQNTQPMRSLLTADNVALLTAGLASDSVARLYGALLDVGLPSSVARFPRRNTQQSGSLYGQFDLSPAAATAGSWQLTVNGRWNRRIPSGGSGVLVLPSTGGESRSWNGNVGLRHSGYIRNAFLSSTNLGFTKSRNSSEPYFALPSGRIRIASMLDDGIHVNSVSVGASSSAATASTTTGVQLRHQLRWFSLDGRHSFTLASDVRHDRNHSDPSGNLLGSFFFNSLEDFEAGRAASFSRILTPQSQSSSQILGGVGISDQFRVNPDLLISVALRADASRFANRPERNPLLEQELGIRNDYVPRAFAISPSLRFSKTLGTAQQLTAFEGAVRGPRWRISGGMGALQSPISGSVVTNAVRTTGLPSGIQSLSCVGAAVPHVDWLAYMADPGLIPSECADGTGGTVFASNLPNVSLISRDYKGQRSWAVDLMAAGPILKNRFNTTWSINYRRNLHQAGTIDRNFDPMTRFVLGEEGGRPIFVEPGSIVPTTGVIAVRDARLSQAFNRVSIMHTDLQSESRQFSLSLRPVLTTSTYSWNAAYTLQWNRRQLQGFESTVGNPLDREWTENDRSPLHEFRLSASYNAGNVVRFGWGVILRSGVPLTPRVAGDINGDGWSNDRPFVFDPATTADRTVATAMQELLDHGSPIARKCLAKLRGQLAGLASCRGPWLLQAQQLSMNVNPLKLNLPQRARLQLSVSNPLGALDMLMHGSSAIRGWGQTPTPEGTLLSVRGFDPVERRYRYEVNPRFGSTDPRQSLSRIVSPVTLNAVLNIDMGPPRERQTLNQTLDRGRRGEGIRATEAALRSTLANGGIINPLARILQQAELLKLSAPVADSLSYLNRYFTTRLDSIWTPIARYLSALPADYDRDEAYSVYKGGRESSYDLLIKMAPGVLAMLTGEQKRLLGTTATYLDLKYLKSVRSSTAGGGAGVALPVGGIGIF
jgi:hypothetical protein